MGRVTGSLSYVVKGTYVGIGAFEEEPAGDRCLGRSRAPTDISLPEAPQNGRSPHLGASARSPPLGTKPPPAGSGSQPGKLTVPMNFVPDTPSPLLHPMLQEGSLNSMALACGAQGANNDIFAGDLALPPAFGDGEGGEGAEMSPGFTMGEPGGFDGGEMSGFYGVPALMYDPNCCSYTACGWCMPLEAMAPGTSPTNGEALIDGLGLGFDGEQGAEGQEWRADSGMLLDQQGCPIKDGMWGDNGMPLEQRDAMMEVLQESGGWGADNNMQMDSGCQLGGGLIEGQGWSSDRTMAMDLSTMLEPYQDGQGWGAPEGGLSLEGCAVEALPDSQGWNVEGGCAFPEQGRSQGGGGWSAGAGNAEQGRGWQPTRSKGSRARKNEQAREHHQQQEFQQDAQEEPQEQQPERQERRRQSHSPRQKQQPQQPKQPQQLDQQQQQQQPPPPQHQQEQEQPEQEEDDEPQQPQRLRPIEQLQREQQRARLRPQQQQEEDKTESDQQGSTESSREDCMPSYSEVAPGADGQSTSGCTTVMLRNIPNKYTREMLVKQLRQEFRGRFDFVYLPIDFKNRCNVGYGFINFRTVEACSEFVQKFDGVDVRNCLPGLNSRKVAEVTPARVQGLEENVKRLRNGPVMNELIHHPEWMPLLLDQDGEEKHFPLPDQPCPPEKPRRRTGGGRDEQAGKGGGRGAW